MPSDPNKFAKELDRAFAEIGLNAEDRERIGEDLASAVSLNLFGRLFEELPEIEKKGFFDNAPEDAGELLKYFEKFVSKEQIKELLKESVKEMVGKFVQKL